MAAVAPTELGPPVPAIRSGGAVALTAFDNPLPELVDTVLVINNDLFNGKDVYGDYTWFPYQGVVPQFVYTALPILSQLTDNWSAYIESSVNELGSSVKILGDAAWALPAAVVTATKQALAGDISDAVATLRNATIVPLQTAAIVALEAAQAVLGNVMSNVQNVITALPGIAQGFVTTTVGALRAAIQAASNIATQTAAALSKSDLETAWNTVVDGLLGPVGADGTIGSSLPGTIEAVTLGPGLGPSGFPNGYAVPSFRMWAEQSQLQLANTIGAGYPVPPPAASRGSAARQAAATAPVSQVSASRRAVRPAGAEGLKARSGTGAHRSTAPQHAQR